MLRRRWILPKVSEAHKESRRLQILEAAMRLFATHGVQRTSMREICAESGLSRGAVYSYFPSKHDIVQGVLDHFDADNEVMFSRSRVDGDPAQTFRALARAAFEVFDHEDATALLRLDWALKGEALHDDVVRAQTMAQISTNVGRFADLVSEMIDADQLDPDLDPHTVALFFGALHEGFKSFTLMGLDVDVATFVGVAERLLPVLRGDEG